MPSMEVWKDVLEQAKSSMNATAFNMWLRDTVLEATEEGLWIVGCDNEAQRDYLEARLNQLLERVAAVAAGKPIRISYTIRPKQVAEIVEPPDEAGAAAPSDDYAFHGFYIPKSYWVQLPQYVVFGLLPKVKPSTMTLILLTWSETWGKFDDRGNHMAEWVATYSEVKAASGLALNSIKSGIREARGVGALVFELIDSAEERTIYESKKRVKLHRHTQLFVLRPRWNDEPIDTP